MYASTDLTQKKRKISKNSSTSPLPSVHPSGTHNTKLLKHFWPFLKFILLKINQNWQLTFCYVCKYFFSPRSSFPHFHQYLHHPKKYQNIMFITMLTEHDNV